MVIPSNNHHITSTSYDRQKTQAASNSQENKAASQAISQENDSKPEVQLSFEAQKLERLEAAIRQSDGVDNDKVESIKQQIAQGHYEVNSASIANNLLKSDTLL